MDWTAIGVAAVGGGGVGVFAKAFFDWLTRSQQSESEFLEKTREDTVAQLWRYIGKMESQIERLTTRLESQDSKIVELTRENSELKIKLMEAQTEIKILRDELAEWEGRGDGK